MSKTLIIAEKPSVAHEIAPLVGAGSKRRGFWEGASHVVSWAVGHLVNIAEPEEQNELWGGRWSLDQLPMVPQRFKLVVPPGSRRQFDVLYHLMHREDIGDIVNATDAGREGELIFRRIQLHAGCVKPVRRLWAGDMTEEGLRRSLASLLDDTAKRNLGLAAFARAEADWLMGMNLSRLFTLKANMLISVGRVQTPVLKLLCDRRSEIEHFIPADFWTVEALFGKEPPVVAQNGKEQTDGCDHGLEAEHEQDAPGAFRGVWHRPPEYTETRFDKQELAQAAMERCSGHMGIVEKVSSRKGVQKPPLPFDLTTLQREANSRFGYSAQETLTIAQALYERHKLVTYPRTDSRYLTRDLFAEILRYFRAIYSMYPQETVPAVERVQSGSRFACVNDKKVTDHHAIIPTAQGKDPVTLGERERTVYDMICRRFIAAFSAPAVFGVSTVHVLLDNEMFIARGKVFKDTGWLAVEPWRAARDNPLPAMRKGARLHVHWLDAVQRQTKSPAHFTDATLLAAMETAGKLVEDEALRIAMKDRGLGTPATRAQIIETLLLRGYVEKKGKRLVPTDAGMRVAALVSALLPDVASPEFTGQWEKKLKDIEAGEYSYPQFMYAIRNMLAQSIQQIKPRNILHVLIAEAARLARRAPDGTCPLCGAAVEEREKVFGCSRWKRADGGCPFVIWKNTLGINLDSMLVAQLLETGITKEELQLTSQSGTSFRARLTLEQGIVRPLFDERRKALSTLPCGLASGPWENPFPPEEEPLS